MLTALIDRAPRRRLCTFISLILTSFVSGCAAISETTPPVSALDPRGPASASIAELWWVMFILGTGVFLLITLLLLYALFVRNPRRSLSDVRPQAGLRWLLYGGLILPIVILAVVFIFTLRSMQVLAHQDDPPLTIEVVGHMWWWEVRYPDYNIITANEIYIPTGQTVELHLTSADVIHSFWVPELHGKMDLVPGVTHAFQIQADHARTYRGICAEFCGLQHAKMHFLVVAEPPEAFDVWLQHQQTTARTMLSESARRGQEVFFEVGCQFCHAIGGTDAVSRFGPDLTHFASRQTIGAASLPNNRGNLGGWVTNAQSIKPGSRMPPIDIPSEDVQPLLDFLESLD